MDDAIIETFKGLELTQSEADSMTDSELMARAQAITEAVINLAVDADTVVSAEAKFAMVDKFYGMMSRGVNDVLSYVPYVAFMVGLRLSAGWMGHCLSAPMCFLPDYSYMKPPAKKDAEGAPSAASAVAQTDNDQLLAQLHANNFNAHL